MMEDNINKRTGKIYFIILSALFFSFLLTNLIIQFNGINLVALLFLLFFYFCLIVNPRIHSENRPDSKKKYSGIKIFNTFLSIELILGISNFFIRASINDMGFFVLHLFLILTVAISLSFSIMLIVFSIFKDRDLDKCRYYFTIISIIIFIVSYEFFKIYLLSDIKISFIIKDLDLIENSLLLVVAKIIIDMILTWEIWIGI